ncbi:MAG: hypothetical protein BWY51_00743 [Parcubacteria group bacterium ADurb.Bin316]|nr:MAG: hypothetical protein BWY51_00743 [Parcubacteria group bacterium ADurb.Bin316]HOZ56111.1 hypothetical protein [bacterium]
MNLFKSYIYNWWQMAILKTALIAAGVAIGSYWHEFFRPYLMGVIIIWLVAAAYSLYISFKRQEIPKS